MRGWGRALWSIVVIITSFSPRPACIDGLYTTYYYCARPDVPHTHPPPMAGRIPPA